uniref:Uncharacterized protein n=1 Tax=Arundo donax TaxID=35708 RepID=A0A0A9H489_ARUDO
MLLIVDWLEGFKIGVWTITESD